MNYFLAAVERILLEQDLSHKGLFISLFQYIFRSITLGYT
jgi:hypothetical protein